MTFYDSRTYYFNKLFLSILGQWPYQSRLESNAMCAIAFFFTCSLTALELWGLITRITDLSVVMENASPLMANSFILIKLINYIHNKYKMKELLDDIMKTWESRQVSREIEILQDYAEQGTALTIRYSIALYSAWIFYVLPPVAVSCIYSVLPMNETYNARFLYRIEHVIDVDKYFNWLMLHAFISVFYLVQIVISVDCMFVTCIQYLCAFFAIIRHNLERIRSSNFVVTEPNIKDDEAYHIIIDCIKFHKHALKFSELLSSAYAMSYLFLLANVTISLSFHSAEFIMLDIQADEYVRIASTTIAQLVHLYYLSLTCQKLIDYSSGLHEVIYSCNWYTASLRSRRLLMFMLLRTTKPCQIKAGKMYVMSMENFSSILQVSLSYFTMLTSMQ